MSKKRTTVYEDQEEKKRKHRQNFERHLVPCPHCGEKVLDHMTKCPKCGGELTPRGYNPMNEKTMKIVKIVLYSVCIAVAVAIAAVILITRH